MHGSLVTINDYNLNLKDYYNINMYIKCYKQNTTLKIKCNNKFCYYGARWKNF